MKRIVGIIYTKEMPKLCDALGAMGLTVHEITYDGRRAVNLKVIESVAYMYRLLNIVKIRTVISDELVGAMMETLHSFGNCKFNIIPEEHICFA
jgi:nitrogen regulatory protein PII